MIDLNAIRTFLQVDALVLRKHVRILNDMCDDIVGVSTDMDAVMESTRLYRELAFMLDAAYTMKVSKAVLSCSLHKPESVVGAVPLESFRASAVADLLMNSGGEYYYAVWDENTGEYSVSDLEVSPHAVALGFVRSDFTHAVRVVTGN